MVSAANFIYIIDIYKVQLMSFIHYLSVFATFTYIKYNILIPKIQSIIFFLMFTPISHPSWHPRADLNLL